MEYLIVLTFFLAPAYVARFSLAGLPANALLVWIFLLWAVFIIWLIATKRVAKYVRSKLDMPPALKIIIGLFLLAGTLALFVGGFSQQKLGQYLVWFVQPVGMFYIARYVRKVRPQASAFLLKSFYVVLAISGLYAIYQYFTLHGLPPAWWGNSVEPKRAISFFVHPNAYALFITPLLAFLLPDLFERIRNFRLPVNMAAALAWLLGAAGLVLSLSRGAWLGLAAAAVVFVVVGANKKLTQTALALGLVGIIIAAAVPNLRWRVILPFYGERSSSARVSLWQTGWHMVQDNPIVGKGLLGADHSWNDYAVDSSLGHYPFPHNIFLDAWIDTGLLGLISFVALCAYGIWHGLRNRANLAAFGLALFLIALLVQGQIDNPYFKNDLALTFWLVWAMVL